MSILQQGQRRLIDALAWKSKESDRPAKLKERALTSWDSKLKLFVIEGLLISASPRYPDEQIEITVQTGKNGHWINTLSDAAKGDPWERMVPARPYRLGVSHREQALCGKLLQIAPLIVGDLENDPRLATDARSMRNLIRNGCWSYVSKPLGCASIHRLFDGGDPAHPTIWQQVPPDWRRLPDADLLSLRRDRMYPPPIYRAEPRPNRSVS